MDAFDDQQLAAIRRPLEEDEFLEMRSMKRELALADPTGERGEAAFGQLYTDVQRALTGPDLVRDQEETLALLAERTGHPIDMLRLLTHYQGQCVMAPDSPIAEFLGTCLLVDDGDDGWVH